MWKIYILISALSISLINGQCNSRNPCVSTKSYPNRGDLFYENNTNSSVAPTNNPVLTNQNENSTSSLSTQSNINANDFSTAESFNSKLFSILTLTAQHQNLVYSPISLQTLLSFILSVSEGKLSDELRQLLALSNNRTHDAGTIINNDSFKAPPTICILANKFYYDNRFGIISQNIRSWALNSFASDVEGIDFLDANRAANTINSWVSEKTRNLIRDIVTPSTISPNTNAVLINSIYFKSEWLNKFATFDTQEQQFHMTKQLQVPVEMMFNEDVFRYAEFSDDLQASVVEMPYKSDSLTMMLILPQDIEGLSKLEQKLSRYNLQKISEKLKNEIVTIKLPKFKIEYDVDMMKPLQQLGLHSLFNGEGKINLFKKHKDPLAVDQVKHKSFISVNEVGTEAAAASFAKYVPLSIPTQMKYFIADHPFVFVIRSPDAVLFMGHVAKF